MEKKKILIYAHYYSPDTASTGQILRDLAEGLLEYFDVTVICVVPSYLGMVAREYQQKCFYREEIGGVKLLRVWVPEFQKSDMPSRVCNILAYFFGAMVATFKVGKQNFVFAISQPPVLGGLLGVWGKWIKRAKFIYNIQDFNPEQIIAVDYTTNKWVLSLMQALDKFSCKRANSVILVGRDMVETLRVRFGFDSDIAAKDIEAVQDAMETSSATKSVAQVSAQLEQIAGVPHHCLINNWIDETKIYPLPANHTQVQAFRIKYGLVDKFVIMYSGNIGLYYDLENLMKVMQMFPAGTKTAAGQEVVFAFVGDGSLREQLVEYKQTHQMQNVMFIPYQPKEELIYSLNAADVHWCVSAKGIKGVSVPSKCYGIMAVGKPVLAVLEQGSECELLINQTGCGLCCEPTDYETVRVNIAKMLGELSQEQLRAMGAQGCDYLLENLTKKVSVQRYAEEILRL